jgi:anti-sigma28 factor (negative regulator of flagellin synthesis)
LTGGLARALQTDASQRQVHVARLADDYTAGRYQVDAKAVSKAMVAEMRASAS